MSQQQALAQEILEGDLEAVLTRLGQDEDLLDRKIQAVGDASPLSFACLHGQAAIVRELLQRSPDLICQDAAGRSALHCGDSPAYPVPPDPH